MGDPTNLGAGLLLLNLALTILGHETKLPTLDFMDMFLGGEVMSKVGVSGQELTKYWLLAYKNSFWIKSRWIMP